MVVVTVEDDAGADPSAELETEKKLLRVLDGEGLIMSVSAEKRDRKAGLLMSYSEGGGGGTGGSAYVGGVPRRADRRVAICRCDVCQWSARRDVFAQRWLRRSADGNFAEDDHSLA